MDLRKAKAYAAKDSGNESDKKQKYSCTRTPPMGKNESQSPKATGSPTKGVEDVAACVVVATLMSCSHPAESAAVVSIGARRKLHVCVISNLHALQGEACGRGFSWTGDAHLEFNQTRDLYSFATLKSLFYLGKYIWSATTIEGFEGLSKFGLKRIRLGGTDRASTFTKDHHCSYDKSKEETIQSTVPMENIDVN